MTGKFKNTRIFSNQKYTKWRLVIYRPRINCYYVKCFNQMNLKVDKHDMEMKKFLSPAVPVRYKGFKMKTSILKTKLYRRKVFKVLKILEIYQENCIYIFWESPALKSDMPLDYSGASAYHANANLMYFIE